MDKRKAYLEAACAAASWINSRASVARKRGLVWPDAVTPDSSSRIIDLYSGSSGVLLFLVELYYATGDRRYLDYASGAGDGLLARFRNHRDCGLYTGLAGIAFALWHLAEAEGGVRFREGAKGCVELLLSRAQETGSGVEWRTDATERCEEAATLDIFSGSAGIGLFLLWWAKRERAPEGRPWAIAVGERLLEVAVRTNEGLDWPNAGHERGTLNFAHGTSGIVYFLAKLAKRTGSATILDGARRGAAFLLSRAYVGESYCLLPYVQPRDDCEVSPGERSMCAMNWCHGPAGTGLAWYQLYEATLDPEWLDLFRRTVGSLFPGSLDHAEFVAPSFDGEYSVCWCHGLAGNGAFVLNAYRLTGHEDYHRLACDMIHECMRRAERRSDGLLWRQLSILRSPGSRRAQMMAVPQTGFGTGAAGIGLSLLAFHALETGEVPRVTLPDAVPPALREPSGLGG